MNKNIIILVGRGKSTLTNFILGITEEFRVDVFYDIEDVNKKKLEIKKNANSGIGIIIHLQSESEIKKIPLSLKRMSLVFKLDY